MIEEETMRVRKYTGKDMQEALAKVKLDLGVEAVILNSRKLKKKGISGWFSKPYYEVLAAIDESSTQQAKHPKENPFEKITMKTPSQEEIRETSEIAAVRSTSVYPQSMAAAAYRQGVMSDPIGISKLESEFKPVETEIDALRNKVQSMETMIGTILKAVENKDKAVENKDKASENKDMEKRNGNEPARPYHWPANQPVMGKPFYG
jgi:flagellar biosynthesis GTPase FlhF